MIAEAFEGGFVSETWFAVVIETYVNKKRRPLEVEKTPVVGRRSVFDDKKLEHE